MRLRLCTVRKLIREAIEDKEADEFLQLISQEYDYYSHMPVDYAIDLVDKSSYTNQWEHLNLPELLGVFTRNADILRENWRARRASIELTSKLITAIQVPIIGDMHDTGNAGKKALKQYYEMVLEDAIAGVRSWWFTDSLLFSTIEKVIRTGVIPDNYDAFLDAIVNLKIGYDRIHYISNLAPERLPDLIQNVFKTGLWKNSPNDGYSMLYHLRKGEIFPPDVAYSMLRAVTKAIKAGVRPKKDTIMRGFFRHPHPNLPNTPEMLDDLSYSNLLTVRREVASQKNLLPRTIRRLQNDPDEKVQRRMKETLASMKKA